MVSYPRVPASRRAWARHHDTRHSPAVAVIAVSSHEAGAEREERVKVRERNGVDTLHI
jgi:hypothetical protein